MGNREVCPHAGCGLRPIDFHQWQDAAVGRRNTDGRWAGIGQTCDPPATIRFFGKRLQLDDGGDREVV